MWLFFIFSTMFYRLYFKVFNTYKVKLRQKAHTVALWYISILQASLIFLFGAFFTVFFNQMNVNILSSSNVWTLFIIIVIGNHIKNWIQFSGKNRNVARAKSFRPLSLNIWLLWLLPFALIILAVILLQAFY